MNLTLAFRHVRLLRVLSRRWQRHFIFMMGGLVVGLAGVGMAFAADAAQAAFRSALHVSPYAGFILTPLGFGLAAWAGIHIFPNIQGSGIPQVIAARQLKSTGARGKLVGLRAAIGKILLTTLGLAVGASTGREGPTVQVGASVMFMIGRLSPRRQPGLILAGAAGGIAAAFNTPLAGIVFAIEEMSRSFEVRTSGLIIGAVILAGLTSLATYGNYTYFGSTSATLAWGAWMVVPVCGIIGGLCGGLFSRILIEVPTGVPGKAGDWIKRRPIAFAAVCGLLVAICGFMTGGAVNGTGYAQARAVLHGAHNLSFVYAPLKFIATTISSISGLPGGLFSPSLSVGAGLGADLAYLFPHAPIGAIVLIGMVSYFTGVVQAPITSFVIVSEMTDNNGLLIPLMTAALIANACSRLVCKEGVYHALSHRYLHGKHEEEAR
ncbi:MAG: chloride channel protein [Alphaproteobacteria bacterium]|nr:chloride channel protein [Alphaproteobacteria bacterium]MDE2112263.1 chloride channel protein [Alphaproteobacteria bacterium]MDE2495507.1 chloride channel protein [Alphaproteobacteria bacterium]